MKNAKRKSSGTQRFQIRTDRQKIPVIAVAAGRPVSIGDAPPPPVVSQFESPDS